MGKNIEKAMLSGKAIRYINITELAIFYYGKDPSRFNFELTADRKKARVAFLRKNLSAEDFEALQVAYLNKVREEFSSLSDYFASESEQ